MKTLTLIFLYVILLITAILPAIVFWPSHTYSEEATKYFLNGNTPGLYFWGFIFAVMGIFLRVTLKTNYGIKYSDRSKPFFEWEYWINANFIKVIVTFLNTYIGIFAFMRFSVEYLNQYLTMAIAFGIGFSLTVLMEKLHGRNPDVVYSKENHPKAQYGGGGSGSGDVNPPNPPGR